MYEQKTAAHGVNLLAVCLAIQLCIFKNITFINALIQQMLTRSGLFSQSVYFPILSNSILLIVSLLAYILPILFFLKIRRKKANVYIRLKPELPLYPFFTILFCAAAALFTILSLEAAANFIWFLTPVRIPIAANSSMTGLIFFFILHVLLPAFAGEPFFRGVVLNELMPWGRTFAIFAAAITGGLYANSLSMFIFYTVIGLISGYFVSHTDSLWIGIFIRLVANTIYFIDCFIYSTTLYVQYSAVFEIIIAILFVAGIFSCSKIDEQIKKSKVSPISYERNHQTIVQCLLAPCVVAYYIIIFIYVC
ncbi:MAG: CPBP family intramembrane metalloprotease [Clostridiales bacterium]|nr:CPBP family intramembrane metalloprotease [Clostridiales bacterium]